ncbi:hypothetical protein AB0M94_38815 [Streptomyces xanthochromogenes]|uniref:hypothetical protein n=1 Tax=Streptomyces xanthochromogenes TaxID=67384 RepID=UPI0034450240
MIELCLPGTAFDLEPSRVLQAPGGFLEYLEEGEFVCTGPAHSVSGRPRASLVLSSGLPDFGLLVGLCLLRLDEAALLGEAVFRARHLDLARSVGLTFSVHRPRGGTG